MTQRRSKFDPLSPVSLTGKQVHRRPAEHGDSREAVRRLSAVKKALAPEPTAQKNPEETYSEEQLRKRRELAALLWGEPEEGLGQDLPPAQSHPGVSLEQAADEMIASAAQPALPELPLQQSQQPEETEPAAAPKKESRVPPPSDPETAHSPYGGPPLGAAETDPGSLRFERDFVFEKAAGSHHPSGAKIPENLISTPKPHKPVHAETSSPTRAVKRRECAFPGLVRIMVPEVSFQAKVLAIRMVDVSPLGAKIETRQMTQDLCDALDSKRHFCSLEVLVPNRDRITLKGQVAWAEHHTDTGYLGIKFAQPFLNVDDIFSQMMSEQSTGSSTLTLASPTIDRFPAMTSKEKYTFRGEAPRAQEVIVRRGQDQYHAHTVGGRFEIEIPLTPECSNFLSFIAQHGKHRSIPTPVCIVHRVGTRDTMTFTPGSLVQEMLLDEEDQRLFVRLSGEPRRYFQVLRALEHALEHAEEVSMAVEIKGNIEKIQEAIKPLEKGP